MTVSRFSTIGRPIDLSYPSNRAIALITLAITVGASLVQGLSGAPLPESALWGLQAGLAVFLAWALCRELDPDHPQAAFVAAILCLAALFTHGLPELGVVFWLLILLRVVNRSSGLPATVIDALGLWGLAGWLTVQNGWGFGLITALAFVLDGLLPVPARRQLLLAALAVLVATGGAVLGGSRWWVASVSFAGGAVAFALAIPFLLVMHGYRSVESVGDRTGERLLPLRVQAAQGLALLTGVGAALVEGSIGIPGLAPLWAAVFGASLFWLYVALPWPVNRC